MIIHLKPVNFFRYSFIACFILFISTNIHAQGNDVVNYDKSKASKSLDDFDVQYLEQQQGISVLNFSGNYDKRISGNYNAEARQAVLQKFYENHPDEYDFVYIFTEFEFDTESSKAFAAPLSNDIEGIGKIIYDNSQDFFSENLKNIIDMAALSRWNFNPITPTYDSLLDAMVHETMHYWGIKVKYLDSTNQISERLIGESNSHWSYFLNSNASVMYGSLWQEIQPGQFLTADTSHGLSPLDLYLAGFIGKESVADFFIITNANTGSNTDFPPLVGTEIQGSKEIVSINDIIAHEGERIPNFNDYQHTFNVKFILLKHEDDVINSQSIANLYVLQNEFQKRFFADTNGIGQIEFPNNLSEITISDPAILEYDERLNISFNLSSAVNFLLAGESIDWWQDNNSTKVRDTVTTIKALQRIIDDFPEAQNKLSAAITWLNNHQPENNDEIAWMLDSGVLLNDKVQILIDNLNNTKIVGKGWGAINEIDASPYDTALIIKGLIQSQGESYTLDVPTVQFVTDNINLDSGYSFVQGGQSSVSSSSLLLESIAHISSDSQHQTDLVNYLLNEKLPDNSYGGNGVGTPHETAQVILALASLNDDNNETQINFAKTALNGMQSEDGSMQGSIYSTALAISALYSNTKSNLRFKTVNVLNQNVIAGEQVLVNFVVENNGVLDANNVDITIYKDSIIASNIINQTSVAFVLAGQQQTAEATIDTSGFNPNTTLFSVIDTNDTINENNEDDNVYSFSMAVQQPSSTPELAFNGGLFVVSPSSFDSLPLTINASATVSNLSLADIDNITLSLSKIESNGDLTLLDTQVANISSLENQAFNFTAEIAQTTTDVPLVFKIDPENLINEVNEENNLYHKIIKKTQSVDIVITQQDVIMGNQAIIGENQAITFNFINGGTEHASAFDVKVYAEIDATSLLIFESQISEVNAGEIVTRSFSWIPQEEGNYNIRFVIDEANQLAETDELNNDVMLPLQVVENVLTNITLEDTDVSMTPDPGLQGQNLQFNLTIHNTSAIESGSYDVSIFQQMPSGSPNNLVAELTNNPSIVANSSTIIQVDIPETSLSKNNSFIFEVDSSHTVSEFNENDNIIIKDFRVLSKPDAYISSGSFQLAPSVPVRGEPLSVSVTVENSGEQDLSLLSASLYYDNSLQSAPVFVETQNIALIPAVQSQLITFTFNYPNDESIDTVLIRLDELNNIDEGSESNNQASVLAGNQDATLYVTQKYFSPNSDEIKDDTTIIFNTEIISNYRIKIIDGDFNLIKLFDYNQLNQLQNTAFGDVTWDGRNDRGVLARDGEYQIQLVGESSEIVETTLVTLDTNKSSLFNSLAENNVHTTALNCLGDFHNSRFQFSHDGKHIYTSVYRHQPFNQIQGLFKIKSDGSSLNSIIPAQIPAVNYNVLTNGDVLYNTQKNSVYQLYILRQSTGSHILLDSNTKEQNVILFTTDFVILNDSTEHKLIKIYYDTSITTEEIHFQDFISTSYELNNGLLVFQQNTGSDTFDLYFVNFDLNQSPVLIASDLDGIERSEFYNPKNLSTNTRNFIFKKNETLYFYSTVESGLELSFTKSIANNESYGFNSHNEIYLLNHNQQIVIYNKSGNLIAQSEVTRTTTDFEDYLNSIDSVPAYLGGEGPYYFDISEMFDPFVQQEVVSSTDYTDKKELVLLIKNTLIGQFNTPECGDIHFIVPCEGWNELTQAPVVTVYTTASLDYSDLSQLLLKIVEVGEQDFITTNLNFSNLQEGRSEYIQGSVFDYPNKGLINRGDLGSKQQWEIDDLAYTNATSFPQSIELIGNNTFRKVNRVEILNSVVLDGSPDLANPDCEVQNSGNKYIYRSKDNLYADIAVSNQQNGVQINATAFDKDFARYELHWSSASLPGIWNHIHTSIQSPINGDIAYNWIPSQSGFYHVRLTAIDKAGNTYSDTEQIFVNQATTSINNIEVSPNYFSPNGDGIKDTVDIQYEITNAAEVLVEIQDETGLTVHSYTNEYINPVANVLIQWDGKNQNGLLLPDGKYQVVVQGFRYDVYLDTNPITNPSLTMSPFQNEINKKALITMISYPDFDTTKYEDYYKHSFQSFNQLTNFWEDDNSNDKILHSDTISEIFNGNYRLKVEDKAGNIGFSEVLLSFNRISEPGELSRFIQSSVNKNDQNTRYGFPFIDNTTPNSDTAPGIVNWSINNKLAYEVQVLNYGDIEYIQLITSYRDPLTHVNITSSKFVNSLLPNMAAAYYDNESFLGANVNGSNYFDIALVSPSLFEYTELPFLMIELEKDDFPDTGEIINVTFKIKLLSEPDLQITKSTIQFLSSKAINFRKLTFDEEIDLKDLSLNAENAYQNFINENMQSIGLEYYWVYLEGSYDLTNSLLSEQFEGDDFEFYIPDFIDANQDYYSVFYIIPQDFCDFEKTMKWSALNRDRGTLMMSPNLLVSEEFCINPSAQISYFMGEFCNNDSQHNSIKFEFGYNAKSRSNSPILIELFHLNSAGTYELIYSDTNPTVLTEIESDPNNGHLEIIITYADPFILDTSQFNSGDHIFKLNMVDISNNVESVEYRIPIDQYTAQNQINAPLENTKICAINDSVNNVPINVSADVSLSSPYKLQSHIVINGITFHSSSNSINYQDYNDISKLEQLVSPIHGQADFHINENSGAASFILETINSSGTSYCSSVNIEIDSLVEYDLSYSLLEEDDFELMKYISPNNDGIKDNLTLTTLEALEDLSVNMILKQGLVTLGEISTNQMIINEVSDTIWDGRINGAVVDDGNYTVIIEIVDDCGLISKLEIPIVVDTTDPINNFINPVNAGSLNAIERVELTIDETSLNAGQINNQVNVEYNHNGIWHQLDVLSSNYDQQLQLFVLQLDWNLTNLPAGTYPLRVTTEDLAGNTSITTINPELLNTQDIFWNYQVAPLYISPNADAVQDTATIDFGLNLDAVVSVNIVDENQTVVRSLVTDQAFPVQLNQLTFNGLHDNGGLLSDGVYTVEITASETANLTNSATLQLPLTIDNQVPTIQWLPPLASVTKGEGMAQVQLVESYPVFFEVKNQQLEPLEPEAVIITRNESGTFDLLDLTALNETEYKLTAVATDLAGNSTTASINYLIDDTVPEVTLTVPEDNAFVGGNEIEIAITGSILDTNFDFYQLDISAITEPPTWQTIHTSTELIETEFDYQWLSAVNDGQYLLRLSARDQAGWMTEMSHIINLDTSDPQAIINSPINGAVIGMNSEIIGTANDDNFDNYRLSYKLTTNEQWSLLKISQSAVLSTQLGVLTNNLSSGEYDIKLTVQDKAELVSESQITITLDVEPPPIPLNLTGEIINHQVSLQWDTVTANDLFGYMVYRNGAPLLAQPTTDNQYLDSTVTDGEYFYSVHSVDTLGNYSLSSNQVTAIIDTTPPEVMIISPADSQRVNNTIEIIGTALSLLDFNYYKLYYRQSAQSAPGTLFHNSSVPITQGVLGQLDTTTLIQDQSYVIRLEASDSFDNLAAVEQIIYVDNSSPASPLNLTHQLQGQTSVLLQWTANSESDLVGYLVFQNGVVISGSGDGNASIGNAITTTNFTVGDLIDGAHEFSIAAIDLTGNISQFSNSVFETINSRAPDTLISSPNAAQKFETPLLFEATSPDNDIAEIRFEYSEDNILWTDITVDQQQPFQTTINPIDLNLTFGNLYLRATATDTAAQVDATPAQVTIEYADLTAPLSVENLIVIIEGGDITLNWDANTETDLQGYIVYRISDGVSIELTNPAITNTTYVDSNLMDGTYSYQVIAVDNVGNESSISQVGQLQVFSISQEQPFSPLLLPAQIQLNGQSVRLDGTIQISHQTTSGNTQLADVSLQADNNFTSPSIDLETGLNSFTAIHSVSALHKSKSSSIQIELSPMPQVPSDLQVSVDALTSTIGWNAVADTFAYLPYRNGQAIYPLEYLTSGITYQASSATSSAPNVGDDNELTYWQPYYEDVTGESLTFIELSLDTTNWITGIELTWYENDSEILQPSAYTIQYLSSVGWVTIAEFSDSNQAHIIHTTPVPYLTDKIRLLVKNPNGVYQSIGLSEFKVKHQPTTPLNTIDLVEQDGIYSYQVSSINNYGFESTLTAAIEVHIGDTTTPEAVTLSAAISGDNNVNLSWDASVSTDVSNYWLFRNNELFLITADQSILNYTDIGLANGQYDYTIRAVDSAGNTSSHSNSVTIQIQQQALPIPNSLTVFAVLSGNAAQLNWSHVSTTRFHHYNIYRSLLPSNAFEKVAETMENNFMNASLDNGTTYYYVVSAVDEFGNESGFSNEVSVTPLDSVPASMPVIVSPTINNQPITTDQIITNITGLADSGVLVDLYLNNNYTRTVNALEDYSEESQTLENVDTMHLNHKGKYIAFSDFFGNFVVKDKLSSIEHSISAFINDYVWNSDGTALFITQPDLVNGARKLAIYDTELNEVETVLSGLSISHARPSPDESKVFYQGSYTDPQSGQSSTGLWLYDRATLLAIEIPVQVNLSYNINQIAWSLDNEYIAFINSSNGGELFLYTINSQLLDIIAVDFGFEATLDWSNDNNLLYGRDTTDPQMYIYNVLDDSTTPLPMTSGISGRVHYSPDNSQIAYQQECCNIALYSIVDQTSNVIYQGDDSIQEMAWNATFGIEFRTFDNYYRLISPGSFTFSDVVLEQGINQIHTIARDGSGFPSQQSLPITVTVEDTGLPDIVVESEDFLVSPASALQGSNFVASVLVKNNSDQIIVNADVRASLVLPDGSTEEISLSQNQLSLQPFTSQSVFIDLGIRDLAGDYTIQVQVDGQNLIEEFNEHNNNAFQSFIVLENLDPVVQLFVSPNQAAPNQPVTIEASVFNPANTFTGELSISILDSHNFPVADSIEFSIPQLASNATHEINYIWTTQEVIAGNYQIKAQLLSTDGEVINQVLEQIEILVIADFSVSLDAQNNTVMVNENLFFNSSINYTSGNSLQNGLIQWGIQDANQQTIWSSTQSLPQMLVGFSTNLNNQWLAQTAGNYLLVMEFDTENYHQTLSQPFEVIDAVSVVNLQGHIEQDPTSIILGSNVTIDFNLTNSGDVNLNNIPVTVKLFTPDLSTILSENNSNISLVTNQSSVFNTVLSSNGLSKETYLIALYADLTSVAGDNNQLIDTRSITAIDTIGPEISVISPIANSLQAANVDLRYSITDQDSLVAEITLQSTDINQGDPLMINVNQLNEVYTQSLFNLSQGLHQLIITATDNSGNSSQVMVEYTVDPEAPTIEITGVVDDLYYNQPVTSIVNIIDDNLLTSEILLNGTPIPPTNAIAIEGNFYLSVRAEDSVSNTSYEDLNFTIDFTSPEITVTFPENNVEAGQLNTIITGYTNESALVELTAGSYQAQGQVNGNGFFRFEDVPLLLGANNIELQATDLANNTSIPINLTVNAVNQIDIDGLFDEIVNYPIEEDINMTYTLVNNTTTDYNSIDIKVEFYDLTTHQLAQMKMETIDLLDSQTINSALIFSSTNLFAGNYQVILSVRVKNDWLQKDEKTIKLLTTEFGLHVNLPESGHIYNADIVTSIDLTESYNEAPIVEYRLDDDENWIAMINTAAENYIANLSLDNGSHIIRYRINTANTIIQNTTVLFEVDTIAPEITISNPENGLITNQNVPLGFTVTDAHAVITDARINGVEVQSGDIISDDGDYTLTITATDTVENQATESVQFNIDTTSPTITLTNLIDHQQFDDNGITITGTTEPFASLTLDFTKNHYQTTANEIGEFTFTNVILDEGLNNLQFYATDRANNHSGLLAITVYFGVIGDCSVFGFKTASPYNSFVISDYTSQTSFVEGRLAVGNNVSLSNYYIGEYLESDTAGDVLIAGGDINFDTEQLYFGNILAAGSANIGQTVIDNMHVGATINTNAQLPINFNESYQELRLFSNALVELPINSSYSVDNQQLQLQGDCNARLQIYSIDHEDLENSQSVSYSCLAENAYLILNITGNNIHFNRLDLSALQTIRQRVIWNTYQANEVAIDNIEFQGSILAIDATIKSIDPNRNTGDDKKAVSPHDIFSDSFENEAVTQVTVNGQVIAQSLNSNLKSKHKPLICDSILRVNAAPIATDMNLNTEIDTELPIALNVFDENKATLEYLVTSGVTEGQLTGTMPNVTYVPDSGFTGTVNFMYQVTDQQGKSSTATITIAVGNNKFSSHGKVFVQPLTFVSSAIGALALTPINVLSYGEEK